MWLAREARSDDVHQAGHWSKIGGLDVSDDGCPVELFIFYSLLYYFLAVRIYLNVSNMLDVQAC